MERDAVFTEMRLPADPTVTAPDGSDVRVLLALPGGSMAQFALGRGAISGAVRHRTVDEIWYVTSGSGQIWRRAGSSDTVVALEAGVCLSIPAGTTFQFRSTDRDPLTVIAVTMPPWPGDSEAEIVDGRPDWQEEKVERETGFEPATSSLEG